ncbi:hypothetical protein M5689_007290 [Euphorbia peplus]|nr:hypothetical protein M5689_007290 [Euphorbia peplus]
MNLNGSSDHQEPRFPVIDPNPSFTKVISNFDSDQKTGLSTLAGLAIGIGYVAGKGELIMPSGWWRFR